MHGAGLWVMWACVILHSNSTLLSPKNKTLALNIVQYLLSFTHMSGCWWSARVYSVCMSDSNTAAVRNNKPAGNRHPVPLDCCGGLNNVDFSKVKLKLLDAKLFCMSNFLLNRDDSSDKRRRSRFDRLYPPASLLSFWQPENSLFFKIKACFSANPQYTSVDSNQYIASSTKRNRP